MARLIDSPSGLKRIRTNVTIDPVYLAIWRIYYPDKSLSKVIEYFLGISIKECLPKNVSLEEAVENFKKKITRISSWTS